MTRRFESRRPSAASKRFQVRRIFLTAVFPLIFSFIVLNQKSAYGEACYPPSQGYVNGTISHAWTSQAGTKIQGVSVNYSGCGNNATSVTNANGSYSLSGLTSGVLLATLSKSGFTTCSANVDINNTITSVENFLISPDRDNNNYPGVVGVEEAYCDGADFGPDELFDKTWTLKNNGTQNWDSRYYLKHKNGSLAVDQTNRYVTGTIAPGGTFTFEVHSLTPQTSGRYREEWELYGPNSPNPLYIVWTLIDVELRPNLVPANPPGGSDIIIPSHVPNATTVGNLTDCQPTYVNFAFNNIGHIKAGNTKWVSLYRDEILQASWYSILDDYPGQVVPVSEMTGGLGMPISVSAGTHTLKITVDSVNNVKEYDETDNIFQKQFTWAGCGGNSAPIATITAPNDGYVTTSDLINVSSACDDPGQDLTSTTIENETSGHTETKSIIGDHSGSNFVNVRLVPGLNSIRVDCKDTGGLTGSARITVNYNVCPDRSPKDSKGDPCNHNEDGDGLVDDDDGCYLDPTKVQPGLCGCGIPDTDSDQDGIPNCNEQCFLDPNKTDPGVCGCGQADVDKNNDGIIDCLDNCPDDPNKQNPGFCGCGVPDNDSDSDGIPNCVDSSPMDSTRNELRSNIFGNRPTSGQTPDPVNTATGNFTYSRTDGAVRGGRGMGLEFTRTYNSQDNYDGPLGRGWTHTYNIFITEYDAGTTDERAVIKWGDGHTEAFQRGVNGNYTPPKGIYSTLTKENDNSFTIVTTDRRIYSFSPAGRLVTITDRKGNKITLTYDGSNRLITVADDVSRKINIFYENFVFSGTKITALGGNLPSIVFEYDTDGNLWKSRFTFDWWGQFIEYLYDTERRMTEIIDSERKRVVKNEYDSYSRVSRQWDTDNNEMQIAYDTPATGSVTMTSVPLAVSWVHAYDEFSRIISNGDPSVHHVTYEYDNAVNRPSATIDRNGSRFEMTYDPTNGNLKTYTVPLDIAPFKATTTYLYEDPANSDLVTQIIFPNQHIRNYVYDAEGNLRHVWEDVTTREFPNGERIETFYDYNDWGQLTKITDPEGNVTRLTYDVAFYAETLDKIIEVKGDGTEVTTDIFIDKGGYLKWVTDPFGRKVEYEYKHTFSPNRLVGLIKDPAKKSILINYDSRGNIKDTTDRNLNVITNEWYNNGTLKSVKNSRGEGSSFTYDPFHRIQTDKDGENRILSYDYHPAGNIKSITDVASNQKYDFGYDFEGRLEFAEDLSDKRWPATYDPLGRIRTRKDPEGNGATYDYHPLLGRLWKVTDAELRQVVYDYDAMGRLTEIIPSGLPATKVDYYKNGLIKRIINAAGDATTYSYDYAGRLATRTNALSQTEHYFYDDAGYLDRAVDGRGQTTKFNYDPVTGRLTSINYLADGSSVSFTYDNEGNRLTRTDTEGTTTYTYDYPLNQLKSIVGAGGFDISYDYDHSGLLKKITYPGLKDVTYDYDPSGKLQFVTDWLTNVIEYSYDSSGRLGGIIYPNGFTTEYRYDTASRLKTLTNKKGDRSVLSSYEFGFDKSGYRKTVLKEEPLVPWIAPETTSATYNDENELLTLGTFSFEYDANGNRKALILGGRSTNYTFNARNRLESITSPEMSASFEYDGDGNRISVTKDGQKTRYVIDPNGDLPNMIAEADGNGTIQHYYIHGLGLAARVSPDGSDIRYYQFDPLGSTVALSDKNGTITDQYLYDEFGRLNRRTGTTPNPFQFVGQFGVQRDETGLNYMRARYYDPSAGRFISRDPIGLAGGMNLYSYTENNPVMGIDPSGLGTWGGLWDQTLGRVGDAVDAAELVFDIVSPFTSLARISPHVTIATTGYDAIGEWLAVVDNAELIMNDERIPDEAKILALYTETVLGAVRTLAKGVTGVANGAATLLEVGNNTYDSLPDFNRTVVNTFLPGSEIFERDFGGFKDAIEWVKAQIDRLTVLNWVDSSQVNFPCDVGLTCNANSSFDPSSSQVYIPGSTRFMPLQDLSGAKMSRTK